MTTIWLFVYLVTRVVIAALFASSVLHKARNLMALGGLVRELAPFTGSAAGALGATALALEATIVCALLLGGRWPFFGLLLALALVAIYTALQAVAILSSRETNCDCFELPGGVKTATSRTTVTRNLVIASIAIGGIVAYSKTTLVSAPVQMHLWVQWSGVFVGFVTAGLVASMGRTKAKVLRQGDY